MRVIPMPALAAVAALAVSACSSGEDAEPAAATDPAERLTAAADLLDQTSGVSFALDGDDLPDFGTVILGAAGVAAPPASFDGEIRVLTGGLSASVEVISIDGELWAKLPLTTDFARVEAAALGFSDPGALLDPDRGVGRLLRSADNPEEGERIRVGAAVFDQITATLPGELVGQVLTIADPDAEVDAAFALDPETGHLRQAVLTGPFVENGDGQTYTVRLDDYDQDVDISAPAG
jgi:LppX_LprAFG lipoprotein